MTLTKVRCEHGDPIVVFLADMNNPRFTIGTALAVVERDHVVACARRSAEIHTYRRILPVLDPKGTARTTPE
ncbi:hypothetical protein GCM10009765_75150 [Fodinicola feengrottensis]|uniref:Uncharacterized protein n=1 Tax=Fodinicola feengrottensis TaxID=435914 RepID=A0ABN2IZZ0_9ACTN